MAKKTDDKVRVQMPDFIKQMHRLKSIYHNSWFLPDDNALDEWYEVLQGFSLTQIRAAVDFWIKTNSTEPKPSDLISTIQSSGIGVNGDVSGNPLDWPIVVVSDAGSGQIIYECRVRPQTEGTGAKQRALDYVCGTLGKHPMDLTIMFMTAKTYNEEVLHKNEQR